MKYIETIIWTLALVILIGFKTTEAKIPDWQNDKIKITIYQQPPQRQRSQEMQFMVKTEMINGWHISWDNPGDAGIPTEFNFSFPEGWQVFKKAQSFPEKFIYDGILTQYGYGGTAYHLFQAQKTPHSPNPTSSVESAEKNKNIALHMSWVACKDYCEPENADFQIVLPRPDDQDRLPTEWQEVLKFAEKTFPRDVNWKSVVLNQNYLLTLTINTGDFKLDTSTKPFYFIPCERGIISAASQQNIRYISPEVLEIVMDAEENNVIPQCGMLIYGDQAFLLDLQSTNSDSENVPQKNFLYILLLAFGGGLILNLMPCIFPILSIKALSLAQSAQRGRHWLSGILYLGGVLTCFILFAAILYIIRLRGDAAGWGFQLQSPLFVAIMLIIFILILLMMLDIIVPSGKFLNFFNRLGSINSFLTGFFAVLIASPCTGPFMGAALGYALFQPADIYFPVFVSLGLGYALPFTLIEIFPGLVKKLLPNPGQWMTVLKRVLALPIALTCLWLGWVLANELGIVSHASDRNVSQTDLMWQSYKPQEFEKLVAQGKPVFVDFTAKWCITCLVNEKSSLQTKEFLDLVKKKDITLVKADWTNHSPEIAEALKKYGRNSIPLYVYYPGNNADYVILPQILTPKVLKEYIETDS